jgi:hypothetical protein
MGKIQNTYNIYYALASSFKSLPRDEKTSPKESDASHKKTSHNGQGCLLCT